MSEIYNDKYYIMNCDMPSELFTVCGIKKEYRTLAKIWHPDISSEKEALFIMSKINALYNEGQILIDEQRFYEKERLLKKENHYRPPKAKHGKNKKDKTGNEKSPEYSERRSHKKKSIELIRNDRCVRFRYIRRIMIELGFMYISEEHVMFEISKLKRKIFMDSIEIIQSNGKEDGYFKIDIPEIVDTFDTDTHGYLVIKKERGVEPVVILENVTGYVKALGCRKICEGTLYDLTALKYLGLTSTGIDRDLWFINVDTGKLINYGLFFYLHEFNAKFNRAPEEVSEIIHHIKVRDTESMVIDLVKDTMIKLNEKYSLKADDFQKWLHTLNSNSLEMSLAESQVFNRAIASVTTPGFDLENYYRSIY